MNFFEVGCLFQRIQIHADHLTPASYFHETVAGDAARINFSPAIDNHTHTEGAYVGGDGTCSRYLHEEHVRDERRSCPDHPSAVYLQQVDVSHRYIYIYISQQ